MSGGGGKGGRVVVVRGVILFGGYVQGARSALRFRLENRES